VEACDLVTSECGFTEDVGQCNIDCSMVFGGFAGAFYGAGLQCWENAVAQNNCDIASQCPTIYY
jgi:hypothetical protein